MSQNVTHPKVVARRQKVMELLFQGYNNTEIAEELDVNRRTVHRDIEALDKELKQQLSNEEYSQILVEVETTHKNSIKELMDLYKEAKAKGDVNSCIRIMKLRRKLMNDYVFNLQKLGVAPKQTKSIELSGNLTLSKLFEDGDDG